MVGRPSRFLRAALATSVTLLLAIESTASAGDFLIRGCFEEFPNRGCGFTTTKAILEPLGRQSVPGPLGFEIAGVPPGEYVLTSQPTCNPFGCWVPQPVNITTGDAVVLMRLRSMCSGDCTGRFSVSISDLVKVGLVGVGERPVAYCYAADRNQDGDVTADELTAAISAYLYDCPPGPRPPGAR